MSGENPSAPPAIAENEAPSLLLWRVDGEDLLVRNGAVLPEVDLETGETGDGLQRKPRANLTMPARSFNRTAKLVLLYFAVAWFFGVEGLIVLLGVGTAAVLFNFLARLRGKPESSMIIWEFIGPAHMKGRKMRIMWRLRILNAIGLGLLIAPFVISTRSPDHDAWMLRIFGSGIGIIALLYVWANLDRPKSFNRNGPPGWLRISPIHPDALKVLMETEHQMRTKPAQSETRKRLVHTVYLHRYPLRMLLGHQITNPLAILICILMKLLRSRWLVRDAYHFSEAEERSQEQLHPGLREAAAAWLAAHPGWTFISGDHLTSPAGDFTGENAILASPGLEHIARIDLSWRDQRANEGVVHHSFLTRFADGTDASTYDQPFLILDPTHTSHRATGTPEQVWQAHLRHVSARPISPAADTAELRARLLRDKEETERLLTEKGLHSETREVEITASTP